MSNKTKLRKIKAVNKYKLLTSHHYVHAVVDTCYEDEQNNIISVFPIVFANSKGYNLMKFCEIVWLVLLFLKAFDYFKHLPFINERGSDGL